MSESKQRSGRCPAASMPTPSLGFWKMISVNVGSTARSLGVWLGVVSRLRLLS